MDDMTRELLDEVKGMRRDIQGLAVTLASQHERVDALHADRTAIFQALATRDREGCGFCRRFPDEIRALRGDLERQSEAIQPLILTPRESVDVARPVVRSLNFASVVERCVANWRTLGVAAWIVAAMLGCERVTSRLDAIVRAVPAMVASGGTNVVVTAKQ